MLFSYIFDFDGVIAKTMEQHYICYKQALGEIGVPIIKEQFYSQAGMTALEQINYFCGLFFCSLSAFFLPPAAGRESSRSLFQKRLKKL